MQKRRRFYLMIILGIPLLLLAGLKTVAHIRYWHLHFEGNYLALFNVNDDNLGYVPVRDTVIHSIKMYRNDTVYNVFYHIDENGRRKSVCAAGKQPGEHLLFFGCSFTYGEGLNDTSTFPYLTDCTTAGYRTYNFGYSGYGPQAMLASLQSGMKGTGVKEDSGIAIYTLIAEHVYRANGAMFMHNHWGSRLPYYVMENNHLIRKGNFTTGRPLTALVYKMLNLAGLDQLLPQPKIKKADIDLTVTIIAESKKLYLQQCPHSRFYVMLYPIWSMNEVDDQLKAALLAEGVNVLDYRNLFKMDSGHTIKGDGHPNGLANHIIASRLAQDLGL